MNTIDALATVAVDAGRANIEASVATLMDDYENTEALTDAHAEIIGTNWQQLVEVRAVERIRNLLIAAIGDRLSNETGLDPDVDEIPEHRAREVRALISCSARTLLNPVPWPFAEPATARVLEEVWELLDAAAEPGISIVGIANVVMSDTRNAMEVGKAALTISPDGHIPADVEHELRHLLRDEIAERLALSVGRSWGLAEPLTQETDEHVRVLDAVPGVVLDLLHPIGPEWLGRAVVEIGSRPAGATVPEFSDRPTLRLVAGN